MGFIIFSGFSNILSSPITAPPRRILVKKSNILSMKPFTGATALSTDLPSILFPPLDSNLASLASSAAASSSNLNFSSFSLLRSICSSKLPSIFSKFSSILVRLGSKALFIKSFTSCIVESLLASSICASSAASGSLLTSATSAAADLDAVPGSNFCPGIGPFDLPFLDAAFAPPFFTTLPTNFWKSNGFFFFLNPSFLSCGDNCIPDIVPDC